MILRRICAAMLATPLLCGGCSVSHNNSANGGDNVKIATPFGGMSVKANTTTADDVGLAPYPGATPLKDDNNGSAKVAMNFGGFHLKVLVAAYSTPDSADKVFAYYRPLLAKYGDVIECDHGHPVGTPSVASSGLGCSDDKVHVSKDANYSSGGHQLRAGSPRNFRVVEATPKDGQTKIGLYLPGTAAGQRKL